MMNRTCVHSHLPFVSAVIICVWLVMIAIPLSPLKDSSVVAHPLCPPYIPSSSLQHLRHHLMADGPKVQISKTKPRGCVFAYLHEHRGYRSHPSQFKGSLTGIHPKP
ncbi:hypothetical protein K466DRAFT_289142 [Polyporus arcularius HHB13444]|uniref:Uncharacterized protein n=1 Tax=Polyporus arcularius HHB13444 TaxID=1314778 RepID=A0A5C3P278_9APHY|nr:hypothetical protein K466DRAFT_289142 [Polyporus arcularius HHB13444]